MLLKAAREYNIDLAQSFMVGDGENDMQAGLNAGCRIAYIGESARYPSCESLLAFAKALEPRAV